MKKLLFTILIGAVLQAACLSPPPTKPDAPAPAPRPRLAVLPFISGGAIVDDLEETFAWRLANIPDIQKYYNIVPITPQIRKNIKQEQNYHSALDAGAEVHADYVLVSFVRKIDRQWIMYTLIMDVATKELITGDYRKFDFLEDIPMQFPAMTAKMLGVVSQGKNNVPKLAVDVCKIPPMNNIAADVSAVLTQLLANEMANNGMFRIFPRTDNIDAASIAYEKERRSAQSAVVDKSDLTAADFVLSCKISSLTTPPRPPFEMLGEIVNIENNRLWSGSHVSFDTMEDAPEYIVKLAKTLSTIR
ncbi:MAG: penicillin-binding protein activator LpoB [Spirochaetaceae bacterium]|nr:penicillin-binding protein activator LpoB [Spirochaetaceae bacterium]